MRSIVMLSYKKLIIYHYFVRVYIERCNLIYVCIKRYGLYGYNKKNIQSNGDTKVNVIEKEVLERLRAYSVFYVCNAYTVYKSYILIEWQKLRVCHAAPLKRVSSTVTI